MPITLEARRDFIEGVAALSLWLAHKLAREGLPLHEALTYKTNLYRLTSLYDGGPFRPFRHDPEWRDERWEELLAALRALFERPGADVAAFERDGYERLRPFLEERLPEDVKRWPRPGERPFGFFSYNYSEKDKAEGRIKLHLANPFAPQSPFAERPARAQELSALLGEAAEKLPNLQHVACGSWLNSLQPFLGFFPPEWAASASQPSPLNGGYGWWGQFVERTGAFHRKNGAHLRRTGRFPFPCVSCSCTLPALRRHLKERFGEGPGA